jgi:hypothetical protein
MVRKPLLFSWQLVKAERPRAVASGRPPETAIAVPVSGGNVRLSRTAREVKTCYAN